MKRLLAGSLGVSLGLLTATASAQDYAWRPGSAVTASAPAADEPAAVSLGEPVPVTAPTRLPELPVTDSHVQLANYTDVQLEAPRPIIVRGQAPGPDPIVPPPLPSTGPIGPPPGVPPAVAVPVDPFTGPVVPAPPPAAAPAGQGFWGKVGDTFGFHNGRCTFQSDHCFDGFISPVSNPFLFEDPRSLTEIRPIFMAQGTPDKNPIFHGGDIEFFGVQGRLALTDRLDIIMPKLGWTWIEPHNDIDGFAAHSGFSELWIGPKYTFVRCENSGTLAAVGLNFQLPVGDAKVFQDTGDLSLEPYVSFGQEFRWPGVGNFHFLNTTGYTFAVDSKRTDYFFSSFHLDYDLLNSHHIYPLVELNWFHYTSAGKQHDLNFEGTDLFNFGSTGVSGQDFLSLALGARFKLNEAVQTGIAIEFPLTSQHELSDYRLTFDVIFRF
ncbi:MAG TPA: hypothetical protein VFA18_15690 [Gemmataceae bacterium]|nr:hypothetical protein [Gemmataceae bacterium]